MSCAADLIVVGGGPAGCAAAIWAALGGLRVTLFERARFPRPRPGETLHPGAGVILQQLGVEELVAAASNIRHGGITIGWGGEMSHTPFATTADAKTLGYQILRERLDGLLLARALEVGVEVIQPSPPLAPIVSAGCVLGVRGRSGERFAAFVVDATGSAAWLTRNMGLPRAVASPPLRVHYGYAEGDPDGTARDVMEHAHRDPTIVGDPDGWTWVAEVSPGLFQWTRLWFRSPPPRPTVPPALARLRQRGLVRGADVTWRSTPAAGPGYFLAGDAAAVLDPSSSHGVLRALMSGMMAAHAIRRFQARELTADDAALGFHCWMSDWFHHDVGRLTALYRQLGWAPDTTKQATIEGG